MTNQNNAAVGVPGKGIPRAFSIADLVPRANSPSSRSARVVNAETTGSQSMFAGVFWSDPGSKGGWSFGDHDPQVEGVRTSVPARRSTSVCAVGLLLNGRVDRSSSGRATSSTGPTIGGTALASSATSRYRCFMSWLRHQLRCGGWATR